MIILTITLAPTHTATNADDPTATLARWQHLTTQALQQAGLPVVMVHARTTVQFPPVAQDVVEAAAVPAADLGLVWDILPTDDLKILLARLDMTHDEPGALAAWSLDDNKHLFVLVGDQAAPSGVMFYYSGPPDGWVYIPESQEQELLIAGDEQRALLLIRAIHQPDHWMPLQQ